MPIRDKIKDILSRIDASSLDRNSIHKFPLSRNELSKDEIALIVSHFNSSGWDVVDISLNDEEEWIEATVEPGKRKIRRIQICISTN